MQHFNSNQLEQVLTKALSISVDLLESSDEHGHKHLVLTSWDSEQVEEQLLDGSDSAGVNSIPQLVVDRVLVQLIIILVVNALELDLLDPFVLQSLIGASNGFLEPERHLYVVTQVITYL